MEKKPTNKKSLFAGSLWALYNFDDPNMRYKRFLKRGAERFSHFIDGLLLYDEVVVPTQDYMSLAILVGVLGERSIIDLLNAGDLRFARLKGAFAYSGGGRGLGGFKVFTPEDVPRPAFSDDEDAVSWALGGLDTAPHDPVLARTVLEKTSTVDCASIDKELKHETYMDVLQSEHLRRHFAIRSKHMDCLPGIEAGGVRIYGGPDATSWKGDEIDVVLRLCAANCELRLAELTGCQDATTANDIGHILKAKTERSLGGQVPFESLVRLMELNQIPDPASFVRDKPLEERGESLRSLMKVKRSQDGAAFRQWFQNECCGSPQEVAREYIEVLKTVPGISRMPVRIMRFLVTSILGQVPGLGVIASALDSFFVERWFCGGSTKFFIENLKQVVRES